MLADWVYKKEKCIFLFLCVWLNSNLIACSGGWVSLVAQLVKNPPAMRETWIRSLGWEDHLEKEIATHSSILAWRIPWTKVPGGLQFMGLQRVRHNWATFTHSL